MNKSIKFEERQKQIKHHLKTTLSSKWRLARCLQLLLLCRPSEGRLNVLLWRVLLPPCRWTSEPLVSERTTALSLVLKATNRLWFGLRQAYSAALHLITSSGASHLPRPPLSLKPQPPLPASEASLPGFPALQVGSFITAAQRRGHRSNRSCARVPSVLGNYTGFVPSLVELQLWEQSHQNKTLGKKTINRVNEIFKCN